MCSHQNHFQLQWHLDGTFHFRHWGKAGRKKYTLSLQNRQILKLTSSNLPNVGHILGLVPVISAWHVYTRCSDLVSKASPNTEALNAGVSCYVTHSLLFNNSITLFNLLVSHISPDFSLICSVDRNAEQRVWFGSVRQCLQPLQLISTQGGENAGRDRDTH